MSDAGSTARRLRDELASRGLSWSAPVEHFATLGSTSDHLKERARAGAPEWTVVLADAQTAGRGRQGHTWVSPPGNLFLSVLLRPALGPDAVSVLPLMVGVAVAEAAREWGVDARLKWPNDVLAGERKLAGILVEGGASPEGRETAVVGIGVNLVIDPAAVPAELRDRLTSVAAEAPRTPEPVEAAAAVLQRLALWYHALADGGTAPVLQAWHERSVPWWGHPVEVRAGESVLQGRAIGLDPRGALILEKDDGARVTVVSGEARQLRRSGSITRP